MEIKLNEETRFSIGDEIYFLSTENGEIVIKHDKVITIDVVFYDRGYNVVYNTSDGYRVYEHSAFASAYECETQSSWHKKD